MAKKKKAVKKVRVMGVVASIIILAMSIATFGVIAAPLIETTADVIILGSTTNTITGYDFL